MSTISTTDAVGLDATRMGTIATMTNGSITIIGAGLAALYSDTNGVTNVTNVKITTNEGHTYAPLPKQPTRSAFRYRLAADDQHHRRLDYDARHGRLRRLRQGQPSIPSIITLNNSMLTTTGGAAMGYRPDGATISATNTTTQTSGGRRQVGCSATALRL